MNASAAVRISSTTARWVLTLGRVTPALLAHVAGTRSAASSIFLIPARTDPMASAANTPPHSRNTPLLFRPHPASDQPMAVAPSRQGLDSFIILFPLNVGDKRHTAGG